MKEIPRTKKLDVAQYYILGYSYDNIEDKTRVSHGSIANIVRELEEGKLNIPGTSFDQVNDLRQLSYDLKKKGLEPSQALLGLLLFERLHTLGITPELLDKWSELAERLVSTDFLVKDFVEAALRLDELEKAEGKPLSALAEEYTMFKECTDKLKLEVNSLSENKTELIKEAESLRSQLEFLEIAKNRLESDVEIQTRKLQ